jgi:hypothetical protein
LFQPALDPVQLQARKQFQISEKTRQIVYNCGEIT